MSLYERLKTFSKFQIALELMTLAINIGTASSLLLYGAAFQTKYQHTLMPLEKLTATETPRTLYLSLL